MNDSPIELCGNPNPKASVIWLHGLGADGNDFASVVEILNLSGIRFILPHAPYQKVTINNGYKMRAWYDLYGLTIGSREDESGIREAQACLESLIQQEIERGITHDKIVLAGFSQGGAIALHAALRHEHALAGVMALSSYLPLKSLLTTEKTLANQHTPIFMAHGTHDEVISLATSRVSMDVLHKENYQISWHEYPMAHTVCMEEIDDIRAFLQRVLNV